MRAFSSVAISRALKGIRFAFKIVSSLEVAVTICDEPDVREVYRYKIGSDEYDFGVESDIAAVIVGIQFISEVLGFRTGRGAEAPTSNAFYHCQQVISPVA